MDRALSKQLLGIVLAALPKSRRGRVSDWLPEPFNEVVEIKVGSHVRVLRPQDKACRRNRFQWTNLINVIVVSQGVHIILIYIHIYIHSPDHTTYVTPLTEKDMCKVEVNETLTNSFVVMGMHGKELRLQGMQIKLQDVPALTPEDVKCCYRMEEYHAQVRKEVKEIRVGSVIEYLDDNNGTYIKAGSCVFRKYER